MKRLVFLTLLAFLLAGCASDQGRPGGYWRNQNMDWECHKLNTIGWSAGKSPCEL